MHLQLLLNSLRLNYHYIDEYIFDKSWYFCEYVIPCSMLRYIVDGEAVFRINEKKITVIKGDLVYIPVDCSLKCESLSNSFRFISIRFSLDFPIVNKKYYTKLFVSDSLIKSISEKTANYFYELMKIREEDSLYIEIIRRGHLNIIFAEMLEINRKISDTTIQKEIEYLVTNGDQRFSVVVDYIMQNPGSNLSKEELCKLVGISYTSLRRLFKQHTGQSMGMFIRDVRLRFAAQKLILTHENVSIISYSLGFDDANYFSRIFKERYKDTPTEYRKKSLEKNKVFKKIIMDD